MTPQHMIAALDRGLSGYGQTVTLQHTAEDAEGATTVTEEVTCPAKVVPYGPQDLEAGEVQATKVIVSPTGLGSFVVKRDDRIFIDGSDDPSNVEQIESRAYGGMLVRVNLLCRG